MNHWMWPVSLVGILSTAVVCGTDMFFLTIGRPALRLASPSAGTEIMGFFHMFADARMPIVPGFSGSQEELDTLLAEGLASKELTEEEFWESLKCNSGG